ncbi:MAG: hypothetical protein HY903_23570 [Deltaproteobacteria bacterium]|nr:hypothetical protein [Deltaproteobacteria bacterium]
MKHHVLAVLFGLGVLAGAGCSSPSAGDGCATDEDCDLGFSCIEGGCRCRTNDACGVGQYCNPFGACQPRPPCLGNQDCKTGEICDSSDVRTGGSCIPASQCGSSLHCPFDSYCSKPDNIQPGTCQPGCRSTGDCRLGEVCTGGTCTNGGTASDCTLCPATPVPDASFCDYGERCTNQGQCQAFPEQTTVCATCSQFQQCAGSNTVCLLDEDVAGAEYCAPKCLLDADCPNGYEESGCGKLILVDPSTECSQSRHCANGAPCIVRPESATAYCGCVSDSECTSGLSPTCDTYFTHTCMNSGMPCTTDAECGVACVQVPYGSGTAGVCETAVGGCGKNPGFTCNTLKASTAECRRF